MFDIPPTAKVIWRHDYSLKVLEVPEIKLGTTGYKASGSSMVAPPDL